MKEKQVITPGGPRPPENVFGVPPGHFVRRRPDGSYVVEPAPQSEMRGADQGMAEEIVITPGGARPRARVHSIEPEAILDGTNGHYRMLHPSGDTLADFGAIEHVSEGEPLMPRNVVLPSRVAPALGSGWICYASWNRVNTITSFSTTWTVPPAPATDNGQLVYIFNGIQSASMIYQPVLQWGSNGEFGGSYWCVASWYADSQGGPAFHSTPVSVNTGDQLIGIMTLTGQSPQGFSYNCEFEGIANSGYPLQNVPELWQCVETLECYQMTAATDYPSGKTEMASINIQTGATDPGVVWTFVDSVTDVGQHILPFDNSYSGHGEVDIWYGPGPYWVSGSGTVAAGASQQWSFAWGGSGDVGPQLIQAEPLSESSQLATAPIAESLDSNGHLTYYATLTNQGSTAAQFQWRGGGR
jgi:hypothetical protein